MLNLINAILHKEKELDNQLSKQFKVIRNVKLIRSQFK